MRFMLDTNILISGFAFAGPKRRLLQVLSAGGHSLLTNDYLLSELQDVLVCKFHHNKSVSDNILQTLSVKDG